MYCKHCGSNIPDGTVFCTECGTNQTTGNPAPNTAGSMPQNHAYNPTPYQTQPVNAKPDKSNVGLNILSWFIPIFGIIYYFVKKNERPKEAKGTLKTGLISFGVNLVICIIAVVLIFAGTFAAIGGVADQLGDISNDVGGYVDEYEDYDFEDWSDSYDTYEDGYFDEEDETTETTTQSGSSNVNASSDWTDYTVYLNGTAVKLPISWEEFTKKTGVTFNDSQDAEQTLKSNYYTVVTVKDTNGRNFCVELLNDTKDVKTLGECTVISISDFKRYSGNGQADLVFAGNLRVCDKITEAELKQLFGEPDDTWYSDDAGSYSYTYYENYDKYWGSREFKITVYDGVINDLDLEISD